MPGSFPALTSDALADVNSWLPSSEESGSKQSSSDASPYRITIPNERAAEGNNQVTEHQLAHPPVLVLASLTDFLCRGKLRLVNGTSRADAADRAPSELSSVRFKDVSNGVGEHDNQKSRLSSRRL